MSALLTLDEAADRIGVSVKTLRRRMAASTEAGIRPGWLQLGGRVVRWREADLDRWLTEMDEWQRSNVETEIERDGPSDGDPSTGRAIVESAPTSAPRSGSRPRLTVASRAASTGSPRAIVKALLGSRT